MIKYLLPFPVVTTNLSILFLLIDFVMLFSNDNSRSYDANAPRPVMLTLFEVVPTGNGFLKSDRQFKPSMVYVPESEVTLFHSI